MPGIVELELSAKAKPLPGFTLQPVEFPLMKVECDCNLACLTEAEAEVAIREIAAMSKMDLIIKTIILVDF
jgi:hypothetical protein